MRLTPARARVLKAAEGGLVHLKRHLAEAAGVSAGVVDGLVDEGTLESVALAPEPVAEAPDPDHAGAALSAAQAAAAQVLVDLVRPGGADGDAPRRRHRLGQDRGLFRGGRRGACGRAGRR